MAKQDPSDSELEPEKLSEIEEEDEEDEEGEEEEEPGTPIRNVAKQGISEYEKQRLLRIAENKARIEALGLHKMASSLMGSTQKSSQARKSIQRKWKSKVVEEDDDYRPDDDDDNDDTDDKDDAESDGDEDDEDFVHIQSSSKSHRNKVKDKVPKPKKKVTVQKNLSSADYIDEENEELMRAIALSLKDSAEDATLKERKRDANIQEDARRRKRKKSFNNRVQITEDELILHFFQFDEAGRGFLTKRDLQRVATAHDFTWTEGELADMIHCFDSDGDGKLSLDDFRKIVCRCNMIRGSENH
ncbi:nucleolin isoform X2 [Manihot esculenta]|uniref:EF-hand domain-containing protein n=1 Tax=Manihot esculenta TaxID=3983 RepID=A0A2C9VTG0_MANES|nr:nucleolin isoform X2 [Manihot esculenta]OAY49344.1 hypothetical protein MANES_05G048800v8 [Manihot esculenta]